MSVPPPFGVPGAPGPPNHLEGAMGEMLWYLLVRDFVHEPPIRYITEPSSSPLDHGGDGLVVHETDGGGLMFRLWEVKKSTSGPVASTVATAFKQLDKRGTRYLAGIIPFEQRNPDPAVGALVSRSMDAWIRGDAEAAAGVAVALSSGDMPDQCFSTMPDRFDRMRTPNRLRGLLTGLDDLRGFASRVQREVWSGL